MHQSFSFITGDTELMEVTWYLFKDLPGGQNVDNSQGTYQLSVLKILSL